MRGKIFYIIVLFVFQSCAFIEGPDELNSDFGWEKTESENYVFYYRAGSEAEQDIDRIVQEQEKIIRILKFYLNLDYREKIHVYIFNDREDSGFDSKSGHSISIMNTIEVIYGEDGYTIGKKGISAHEITHILTFNGWGNTSSRLLSEGIATAMEHLWQYQEIGDLLCFEENVYKKGYNENIPSVESLAKDFNSFNSLKAYALSGAFVGYLLHNYGVEKFRQLFTYAGKDNFSEDFKDVYNIPLSNVEIAWREYIESYGENEFRQ